MKKILSLGTAAAVLSLTAVAASAAIAPVVSGNATAGGEVVVEVVANAIETPYATFTVETSENLTLVEGVANAAGLFNPANMMFTFASATAPADGTVLLTLTFTVDAAAGDDVFVTLNPTEGEVDTTALTVTVVDEATGDVGDVTIDEGTVDEGTVDEGTVDEGTVDVDTVDIVDTADTSDAGDAGDEGTNPPTGIALAVVPALVAGAAVVASKKRK